MQREIPLEDLDDRDPEWELVGPGYGHEHMTRKVEWDPISNDIRVEGPVIVVEPPVKPE